MVTSIVCLKNENNRSGLSTGGRSGSKAGPGFRSEPAPDPVGDLEPKS